MSLHLAYARARGDAWAAGRVPEWTDAQRAAVSAALVRISAAVTPRIVLDVPLAEAERQELYWSRTLARLEDWLAAAAAALRAGQEPAALAAGRLGLRSASLAELEALPGIGPRLAREIARFLADRPQLDELEPLLAIDGIGRQRLEQLERAAYLDAPRRRLVSPALEAFAAAPSIASLLPALDRTDVNFLFGDAPAIARRLAAAPALPVARFLAFLELVAEHSERAVSLVDGVVASEVERRRQRQARRRERLAAAAPASGAVLVNAAYLAEVAAVAAAAAARLDLMMFLATAAADAGADRGSAALIEALEQAAGRGLEVRVVLDQDDQGERYLSRYINRPVVERLRAAGVAVRLDQPDTLLHTKLLIADRRRVLLGSHNWTRTGLNDTHELSVRLDGEAVTAPFQARFEQVWAALPA